MKKILSQLKINSDEYRENRTAYLNLISTLESLQDQARAPESDSALKKLSSQKKLSVKERVSRLLDPDSSILEIGLLAGHTIYEDIPPGAGVYACIGKISGRLCMIIANIPSVKGGAYLPLAVKKHIRALEIALQNRLPLVYLVDSGGAFLPLQSELFPDRFHFGRIFYLQAHISSQGIPQIACVLGSCTAGGAYIPAMSEQVIMVRGNSTIFLGGPPLVKAATGEEVSAEELGGGEVHSSISGLSDYLEETEEAALLRTRSLVKAFPQEYEERNRGFSYLNSQLSSLNSPNESQLSTAPDYSPEELYGLLSLDVKKPFQVKEVIARLVDESRFEEFKEQYAPTVICGFAHINGFLVGIIANNGILFSESALKATHFIELCEQRAIPLLFLQNIAGFMVGKEYERGGIAKNGAKMVTAVATARVPKYTLIMAGSFGAGNYGMCGRAYDPHFLFTWPHSKISVMGGAQAAHVLAEVKRAGNKNISEQEIQELKEKTEKIYEKKGNAFHATSQLWDDGIIDPVHTRDILSLAFAANWFDPNTKSQFGLFRM